MTRFADRTDEDLMEVYYEEEDEDEANRAFAEIDRRYRPRFLMSLLVPGYNKRCVKLYKMTGLEQKAEELAGEALFKAAESKGRPSARWSRERKSLHAWLFGILHHVVVSYLRKRHLPLRADSELQGPDEPSLLEQAEARGPTPDEALQHQAMLAILRECVEELPAELRQVCQMLFERGLKQTDAAAQLHISAPTLTRRKQEACQRLKRCLRRKGVVGEVLF